MTGIVASSPAFRGLLTWSAGASAPTRRPRAGPSLLERALFVALLSGPPKFRERDAMASLAGAIDGIVLLQIVVWTCGGLWVVWRLFAMVRRSGRVPRMNPAQAIGALFIVALSASAPDSPGVLLTVFTLGQFAVMLTFIWMFHYRYGTETCLRLTFVAITLVALVTIGAACVSPDTLIHDSRLVGEVIAPTGGLAAIGLVLCLSGTPRLRRPWLLWTAVLLFGGLLIASRTRGAYVAVAAYLPFAIVYGRRLPARRVIPLLVAAALGFLAFDAWSSATAYVVRERASVETLSDRFPLWSHLATTVMRESPLIGLGYYSASRVIGPEYNPALGDAHSVFFETLVGGGLLGAGAYLLLAGALTVYAVRLLTTVRGDPVVVTAVGLLMTTLLLGTTSSQAIQPGPLGFSFWLLTAVLPSAWDAHAARRRGTR